MGLSALIILLLSGGSAASAQDQPLVRVNTHLVEVDVVVRAKGRTVTGLKQSDFTIFDQGKPQKIATFSVTSPRERGGAIPLPKGAVSNRLDADRLEPAGSTVVLFDRLNTAPEDQANAAQAFFKYLRTRPGNERVAIYALNKTLRVVQDFTSDQDRLLYAAAHTPRRNRWMKARQTWSRICP